MANLMQIPGLAGILQARQLNQQAGQQELQQAQGLMGILSAVQAQQQRAQALQRDQAMRGVLAALPPDASQEQVAAAVRPYSSANDLLKAATSSADRQVALKAAQEQRAMQMEQQRAMQAERLQQQAELAKQRSEDMKAAQTDRNQARMDAIRLAASLKQGQATLHTQGTLDPEAVKDLAIQSLYDPNATMGYRRDPKMMSQIANERVRLMKEGGVTSEDVVSGRAGFKADTASLNKITPQYDAITAFEKTAIRNGKILMELADKVDTTGVPVAERWIRAGRKAIGGDPDVAKFHAQMNLYRAEAARILTQPNLSGVLTDTARKEMEHVLDNSATAAQIKDTVNLLERDFNNRRETLEEQIASIRSRMRSRASPGGADAVAAPKPAPTPAAAATKIPEFATEEEAIKSGVKGKVKIGGRNATID